MNLDQIALRISNPNSCVPTETPALQELTVKYPYAQVFSILYLKSLSLQNDIGFDEALQKHAYRITDRMKLYDLIHEKNESNTSENTQESEIEIVKAENSAIIEQNIAVQELEEIESENFITAEEDELLQEISSEILFEKGLVAEKIETENEPIYNAGVEIIEKSETYLETESESEDLESIDSDPNLIEISEEIIEEFHASTRQLDGKSIVKEEEIESSIETKNQTKNNIPELDVEIISEIVETIYRDNLEETIQKVHVVEKKSEINQPTENKTKVEIENSKMSFTSWLKSGSVSSEHSVKKEVKKEETTTQPTVNQKSDLIENFIKTEPKISKVKKEFYSPSKKAKESISTEGLIYSETLAEIFAMQGNFPKAITAYQQLMLTNPEKKIFFAKRIEELKEKLNT